MIRFPDIDVDFSIQVNCMSSDSHVFNSDACVTFYGDWYPLNGAHLHNGGPWPIWRIAEIAGFKVKSFIRIFNMPHGYAPEVVAEVKKYWPGWIHRCEYPVVDGLRIYAANPGFGGMGVVEFLQRMYKEQ